MTARRPFRSPLPSAPSRLVPAALALAVLLSAAAPAVGGVECDRTKRYTLGKQNGPYMIMVAAISPLRGGNKTGLTPSAAADQVCYELREQGIPAYVYDVPTETQSLSTVSRDGEERERLMATMRGGVCVLAGNFKSADDQVTQSCLTAIKTKAKCPTLEPVAADGGYTRTRGGGFFQRTQGHTGSPLSRAFVTVNPLLDAEQVRQLRKIRDPLLTALNAGEEYSLHRCPGKYSVVVKEFRGKTLTQVSGTETEDIGDRVAVSDDLNDGGRDAWELCQILRNREGHEAYVWHDRYRSVVTVGSFDSAQDPAAIRVARQFAAQPDPTSGVPEPTIVAVPKGETDVRLAKRFWLLDAVPYAMPVPNM
ncbi:hypothetical protein [Alienimonas californiensis]|uniref:Caspase domain protein n=1 Tax=Alienimonas californiensis TaxID=2527989 RepID=A0A517PFI5_9PLAN|nr:hypothetical protein [Alienimonas californiensis]QDT18147.1 hypothetical protein CA12_42870 [Alienimonas californiensis]